MTRMIRWNPVYDILAMQNAMGRAFDETRRSTTSDAANLLALDVHETSEAYTVVASLPGLTADDIQITLHEGNLSITGEIKATSTTEDARMLINERTYGKFSRTLNMPQVIDTEKVDANFENGVLTLTLPKLPNAQPRQIPVRGSNLIPSHS